MFIKIHFLYKKSKNNEVFACNTDIKIRVFCSKYLKKIIAGTAIIKPNAVVMRASDIPAAKRSVLDEPLISILLNTVIMPTTVPSNPSKGLMLAIVLSMERFLSKISLISDAFSSALISTNSLELDLY